MTILLATITKNVTLRGYVSIFHSVSVVIIETVFVSDDFDVPDHNMPTIVYHSDVCFYTFILIMTYMTLQSILL